jgi:hypothetical protein
MSGGVRFLLREMVYSETFTIKRGKMTGNESRPPSVHPRGITLWQR